MIDARWLVERAQESEDAIILRRQELPPEAFLSLNELKAACVAHKSLCLPIVILSYPWLEPSHPDSKGFTLRLLAGVLNTMLVHAPAWFPRVGVFWEYASCPCPPHLRKRASRVARTPKPAAHGDASYALPLMTMPLHLAPRAASRASTSIRTQCGTSCGPRGRRRSSGRLSAGSARSMRTNIRSCCGRHATLPATRPHTPSPMVPTSRRTLSEVRRID